MGGTRALLAACGLVALAMPAAHAQEHVADGAPPTSEAGADYGASARVKRPVSARNEEDATAAATSVDLSRRPLALETMKDVFAEIPGALALASGGYGAFQSVSLRATDQAQTVWLLGDVPLNGPDSGAFDMSLLPLPQFARLEVYRGGAPVWYGQGSIGGVIRVVPREGSATGASAQAGAGSFGTYEARASSYVSRLGLRPVSLYSGVQVTSARNDFRYSDDNGTRFGPDAENDDVERRLKNAQVLDGTGLLHLRTKALGGHVDAVLYALGRTGGAPGSGGSDTNAMRSSRELHRGLFSLAYTREGKHGGTRRYRLQALASAQGEQRETHDPVGELGLGGPRALEQGQGRLMGRAAGSLELTRVLEATLIGSYAADRFSDRDALQTSPLGPSTRQTEAVAGELRLFGRLWGLRTELRGSIRAEFSQTALSLVRVKNRTQEQHTLRTQVYRLAGLLEPLRGLTLRSSLGTGNRLPTIPELFGDGLNFVPSPDLKPEKGTYVDAGIVWRTSMDELCLVLEANGFWSRVDDKIVQNSNGYKSIAMNVANAEVIGAEVGAELSYRQNVRLVGAATVMDSESFPTEGALVAARELPRQPKARAYARLEGSAFFSGVLHRATVFVTGDYTSTFFYGVSNDVLRPQLTKLGFGAALSFLDDRIELQARVADVLDARGQDYLRLPLPGRFVGFLLSVKEES